MLFPALLSGRCPVSKKLKLIVRHLTLPWCSFRVGTSQDRHLLGCRLQLLLVPMLMLPLGLKLNHAVDPGLLLLTFWRLLHPLASVISA